MKQRFKIYNVFFLLFIMINKSNAQTIHASIKINMPYSLTAKDYIQQGNNVIITLVNVGATARTVRLFPLLESVSRQGMSIQLRPSSVSAATLYFAPGETKNLTFNQLNAINGSPGPNDLSFIGYDSKRYFNNGNLPEGLYRLCINIDEIGYGLFTTCTNFIINSYDPPIILNPQNNTVVNKLTPQNILFNWTPVGIPGNTQYSFKLVDLNITPVNNPNDAFKNNISPFFQQNNILTSSLVYDNTKPILLDGHNYALQITAYSISNRALYKNNGNSQVIVFTYKKAENIIEAVGLHPTDSIKIFTDTIK